MRVVVWCFTTMGGKSGGAGPSQLAQRWSGRRIFSLVISNNGSPALTVSPQFPQ
jgi:hypothetical protein